MEDTKFMPNAATLAKETQFEHVRKLRAEEIGNESLGRKTNFVKTDGGVDLALQRLRRAMVGMSRSATSGWKNRRLASKSGDEYKMTLRFLTRVKERDQILPRSELVKYLVASYAKS